MDGKGAFIGIHFGYLRLPVPTGVIRCGKTGCQQVNALVYQWQRVSILYGLYIELSVVDIETQFFTNLFRQRKLDQAFF